MIQEKTVTNFLKNLRRKNPKGYENLMKTMLLYSHRDCDKDEVFQVIKHGVWKNLDLIENLNQNLKPEKKLQVIPHKDLLPLLDSFIHDFCHYQSYDDNKRKSFLLAAYQVSFKCLDQINFFSMEEIIDIFFREIYLYREQYGLDLDFMSPARGFFMKLCNEMKQPQQKEPSIIDNDISYEQEEELPLKKQPQLEQEEILREDQVIDAIEKHLSPAQFQNFLKIFFLYSKNVISYSEFVQIGEQYLIRLDKNILQSLKNSIESRIQSRNDRNPYNLKLQVSQEKNKGFGENVSYKPFLSTPLQFQDYPTRIVNKKYFCVLYGHEGGLDEQAKQHVKFIAKEELLKTEDEIHEIDIFIQRIKIINSYLIQIIQNQNHPKFEVYLLKLKNMKLLNLLYGKKSNQIYELLLYNPQELLPIIVDRLKEKVVVLQEAKANYRTKWRKTMENNYYKSLDEKSISLKNKEQKLLGAKKLLSDMEKQEKLNKKKQKYIYVYKSIENSNIIQKPTKVEISLGSQNLKFWNPINAFYLVDDNILSDIALILILYVKQVKSSQSEINQYTETIRNFIVNFFKIEKLQKQKGQYDIRLFSNIDLENKNELMKETKKLEAEIKGQNQYLYSDKFKISINENKKQEMLECIQNNQIQDSSKKTKNDTGIEEQFYSAIKSNNESSEEYCQEMQIQSENQNQDRFFFGSFQFYMIYKYFSFACERFNLVKKYSLEKCGSDKLYNFFIKNFIYNIHSVIDTSTYEDIMRAVFQKNAGLLMNFERIFQNIFKNYKEDDFTKFIVQENFHSLGENCQEEVSEDLIFAKTCFRLNKINVTNQKVLKTNFQVGQNNLQPNEFFKFQYLQDKQILVIHKMRSIYSNEYMKKFPSLNNFLETFNKRMIEDYKIKNSKLTNDQYFMKNSINYVFEKKSPFIGFLSSQTEDIHFAINSQQGDMFDNKGINKKEQFQKIRLQQMKKEEKKITLAEKFLQQENEKGLNDSKEVIELKENIVEEVREKKQRLKRIVLRPEHLTNCEKGLLSLYDQKIEDKEDQNDLAYIGSYLSHVKSWSKDLMPRYDFVYFLERIRTLGKKQDLMEFMTKLRSYHIGEIGLEELKDMYKTDKEKLEQLPEANFDHLNQQETNLDTTANFQIENNNLDSQQQIQNTEQ